MLTANNSATIILMHGKSLQFLFILFLPAIFFISCKQNEDCLSQNMLPVSPYSSPVWYPDGTILGFNHIPLQAVNKASQGSCSPVYTYGYFSDSAGFWLMNRNGSAMRRVTTFLLQDPSWSPDGKWMAFCNGGEIYKMAFDGSNLDTTDIIQLTKDNSEHFFPSWSPLGDTIYYDSDMKNTSQPFQIYKMASDGTGQTIIGDKGIDSVYSREPFCTPGNQVLHIRGDQQSTHVFTMDSRGGNVKQLTDNVSPNIYIHNPRAFGNKIFFEDYGVWSSNTDGSGLQQITESSTQGFSIASDGTIAYVNLDITDGSPNSVIDQTHGVIWIMNADGTNKSQLTFNNNY
jgi:Tol biopolymer transport system component